VLASFSLGTRSLLIDPKIEPKILQLTILQKLKDIILYNTGSSLITPYIFFDVEVLSFSKTFNISL